MKSTDGFTLGKEIIVKLLPAIRVFILIRYNEVTEGNYVYDDITAATGTVGHFTQVGLSNRQTEIHVDLYVH